MKIVIFGGSGLVGSRFIELNENNLEIVAPLANEVDILDKDKVQSFLERQDSCDAVVNFAAFTNVERAENQKEDERGICYKVNAVGPKNIAEICKDLNKHLVQISTEYIFDGSKADSAYKEDDKPNPINWYGQTKYFGEKFVLESSCSSTIVRISMPFSAFYGLKKDIARFFLDQLKQGNVINAVEDQNITPTYVYDISGSLSVILERKAKGIYHVCSKNSTTPFEFAKLIAKTFGLDETLIKPVSFKEYNKDKVAKLLKNSWLDSGKFTQEFGGESLHLIEESVSLFKDNVDKMVVD